MINILRFPGKLQINTEFTDEQDSISLEISKAYDVKELTGLRRNLIFNRKDKTINVTDRFAFSKPEKFGTAIITYEKHKQINPDTLLIYNAEYCSEIKIKASNAFVISTETINENNGMGVKPCRIGIDLKNPTQEGFIDISYKQVPFPEDIAGVYRAPEWKKYIPQEKKAIRLEAEKYASESGGKIAICSKPGDSGESIKFWNKANQVINWKTNVPEDGIYAVKIKYCTATSEVAMNISAVPGHSPDQSWILPGTGGWGGDEKHWRVRYLSYEKKPCILKLQKGLTTISLKLISGAANLDWIELIPLK